VSDRATCFTSNEFKKFLENNNISHILTAVSSPQANGQVERVNRVIRPILSKISDPLDHADWSSKLQMVEYSLNNTVHSSTKNVPSILLFGVEQRGTVIDELTEYLDGSIEYPRNFEKIRSEASENIIKSQQVNMNQFCKKHRPALEFEEGDLVAIRNIDNTPNTNKKLVAKFKGPYVIHKRLPHDRYVIRDVDGFKQSQIPYDSVLESDKLRSWIAVNCDPLTETPSNTIETN